MIEIINKREGLLLIRCSSEFDHLDRIVNETHAFLEPLIDDDDLVYKVVLLLSEAITNAIEHGNNHESDKKIVVDLEVQEHRVIIEVEDEGKGFDRKQIEDPLVSSNLLKDGGRGLFLIEEMADEVYFKKGGSRVQIVFHRS